MNKKNEAKKGNYPTYRNLSPFEKEALFALYEKHGGNVSAMIRDRDCQFRSHNQITHYVHLYGFVVKLAKNRKEKAERVIAGLTDAKIAVLERAVQMMSPRQIPLRFESGERKGELILDEDGQPQYQEIYPTEKEIKVAWEIIKTEIGEPTSINKNENFNDNESINNAADELKSVLESLRGSKESSEPVHG